MHPAIEKVARAITEATDEFNRQQKTMPHAALAIVGEPLPRMRARAAIRSFIEYARDNVTDRMEAAGEEVPDEVFIDEAKNVFRAMITALLNEIEEHA